MFLTTEQILQRVKKGFKFKVINELSNNFDVTKTELSELLQIPPKTLNRRQQEDKLSFLESDRVLRFERIYRRTLDVFENREDALKWLKSEQKALGNKKPLEFCNSEIGAHEVQILLGRIEHGVYS